MKILIAIVVASVVVGFFYDYLPAALSAFGLFALMGLSLVSSALIFSAALCTLFYAVYGSAAHLLGEDLNSNSS